ncbi:hypothetical protein, partial [Acinetobacter baumannii]|uniref:hypothetical protein n=1 Tax=Acinetobacter baumannii TaxID=470 RepID=UPI001C45BDCC
MDGVFAKAVREQFSRVVRSRPRLPENNRVSFEVQGGRIQGSPFSAQHWRLRSFLLLRPSAA